MTARCRLCRRVLPNGGIVCLPACPKPKPYEAPAVAAVGKAFSQAAPLPPAPKPAPRLKRRAKPMDPAICMCGAVTEVPFRVDLVELRVTACERCTDDGSRQPYSVSAWVGALAARAEMDRDKRTMQFKAPKP